MFTARVPLILASASPRRQEFLHQLGLEFDTLPASIDETPLPGEGPTAFARRMASSKAEHVARLHPGALVIAADTVVSLAGIIFGKPSDASEALSMLEHLQGHTHQVITGLALVLRSQAIHACTTETTLVSFDHFSRAILQAYVDSGDPLDKAGAYGIQGQGTFLVRAIDGSYSNVVGLPVNQMVRLLLLHRLIQPR